MPVLGDATAIQLGAAPVARVCLGATQLWPSAPPARLIVGNPTRGPHSFGTSNGRLLVGLFTFPTGARDLVLYHFFRVNFAGACSMRSVILTSDGAGTPQPVTTLGYGAPVAVPAAEEWVANPIPGVEIAAGSYFFGAVCNSDSRTMEAANANPGADPPIPPGITRMANQTFNFNTPPAAWPGTSASYVSTLCTYIEYTPVP